MTGPIPRTQLPGTSLEASVLALGTSGWGWWCPPPVCEAVMDAYDEAGGNFIDSADVYPLDSDPSHRGVSEDIIGRWMAARRNRHRFIVATKVGGAMGGNAGDQGLSRAHIIDAVEGSLQRLQTDYIDVYQTHWDDGTDVEETLGAFSDLVKAGKVRHVGACSYSAPRLRECLETSARHGYLPFRTLQLKLNVIDRARLTPEVASLSCAHDISVLAYSPLAGGFLPRHSGPPHDVAESARHRATQSRYGSAMDLDGARRLAAMSDALGVGVVELCLRWVLGQTGVRVAIVGASSVEQLQGLVSAVSGASVAQAGLVRAVVAAVDART
jgi:aryl-alcohol dehydrogenase-like predicted oxidoreductase